MPSPSNPTQISLRGSLCSDLLELIAAGLSAKEAAARLVSRLLSARDGGCSIRLENGVFVFERCEHHASTPRQPGLFQ